MNRISVYFIAILILLYSGKSTAGSLVLGGSNLSLLGYDEPSCNKPYKPSPPYSSDKYAIESYNREVQNYNSSMRIYISCVKRYIENAENDIKRIEGAIDDAIEEAKRDY